MQKERNELHEKAKAEREAFKAANPDKYKVIDCGVSALEEKPASKRGMNKVREVCSNYRGAEVAAIRIKYNLTQAALAYKIGVAPQTISDWEVGRKGVSDKHWMILEKML